MPESRFTVYFIGHGPNPRNSDMTDELDKVGAALVPLPRIHSEDEIIERTADADALIVSEAPITRRVLSSLPNCKAVLRTGVGFDCIDVPAATDNGIAVINVPDLWTREVANQAMTLLLSANRKFLEQERAVRENRWAPTISAPVGPLHTETVGVIGLGRIGSAFARRIAAFEVELLLFRGASSAAEAGLIAEPASGQLLVAGASAVVFGLPGAALAALGWRRRRG